MSQNAIYPSNTTTLPAGSATAANQATQITLETAIAASVASLDTKQPTVGQKAMAASSPVVIASDQSTVPVSGTIAVTGVATAANQATQITAEQAIQVSVASLDTKQPTVGQKAMTASSPVVIASDQASIPVAATLAAGSAIVGNVRIDQTTPGTTNGVQVNAALPAGANVIGAVTQSGTWTVQPGNTANTTAWLVTQTGASTSTLANVASSASNVTLIASNASRKGAYIFNDSTAILYIKFGATASVTSYTVQVAAGGYYELPASPCLYTGIVDGIWASANGNARTTEIS